jgi:hypothetical protein
MSENDFLDKYENGFKVAEHVMGESHESFVKAGTHNRQ